MKEWWVWLLHAVMEPAIFSLPLYDVLFPHIFHYLDVLEIWRFRRASRKCLAISSEYFRVCLSISVDLSRQLDYYRVYHWILSRCEQLRSFQLKGVHCNLVLPTSMVDKHESLLFLLADQPSRTSLQKLTLKNLELHLTHECFRRLANSCSHLKELTLCSITPFDDKTLALLTRNCMSLERLTLRNLPVGGDALLKLAKRCPGLRHLCVAYSYRIKLVHLEEVFKNCPNLSCVDLCYLVSVNDRTVLVLAEYCQQLKQLFVEGCASVSESTLTPLRQRGVSVDIPIVPAPARMPAQV